MTADGAIAATSAFGESATAFGLLPMLIIAVLLAAMALTGIAALLLHRRAQKALDDAQRLSALFDVAAEGIVVCSGLQVITVNPSFCRMAGVSADEAREMMISNLIAEADVIDRLLSNEDVQFETKLHADGATIAIEVTARTIDYRGTQQRLLEIRDIRDRKETQEHVSFLAHHDALTALPNREVLQERLDSCVEAGRSGAVIWIDLDRFKEINDAHGHAMGDRILRVVADKLRFELPADALIARLGGDEFVVLYEDVQDSLQARMVAQQLRRLLNRPLSPMGLPPA